MRFKMLKKTWVQYSDIFGRTILHPQYFTAHAGYEGIKLAKEYAKGILLDVGCGRMPYRSEIEPKVKAYIGLDHPTVSKMYVGERKPEILANVTSIPLKDSSIDTVLLLQVLEHLPEPSVALKEISRVIKKGGVLIGALPFMYPIHDAPYDMARYTTFMLQGMLKKEGFKILVLEERGSFVGFWVQALNVFLLTRIKDVLIEKKSIPAYLYLLLLIIITPFCVVGGNTIGWLLLRLAAVFPSYPNYFPIDVVFVVRKI